MTIPLIELHFQDDRLLLLNLDHVLGIWDSSYGTTIRVRDGSIFDVKETARTIRDMLTPAEVVQPAPFPR